MSLNGHSFSMILHAAAPYWDVFDDDRSPNVALGLLRCEQKAIRAMLSFEEASHLLRLEVQVRGTLEPDASRLARLLERQGSAALTKLVYDREDRTLSVRSAAIWIAVPGSDGIVHALFEDMIGFLDDDEISALSRQAA